MAQYHETHTNFTNDAKSIQNLNNCSVQDQELKEYRQESYLIGCGTKEKDNFIPDTFVTPQEREQEISVTAKILFQIFIK